MMSPWWRAGFAMGAMAIAGAVAAAAPGPVGIWKTFDENTHQPQSLVQISENGGELQGKIVKILQSKTEAQPLCQVCEGERKNQPIEGMVILWHLTRDGEVWDGGQILDPRNGKIYKAKLSLLDGGQHLDVRGYVGLPLAGRSQTWERQ